MCMHLIIGFILIKCSNLFVWLWETLFGHGGEKGEENVETSNFKSHVLKTEPVAADILFRFNQLLTPDHCYGKSDSEWLNSLRQSQYIDSIGGTKSIQSLGQESADIGFRCNHWIKPRPSYGKSDSDEWRKSLKESQYIGEMEFDRQEWARAQDVVNGVLKRLLDEMKYGAKSRYQGLRIDKYVRQGSSRDGLKVIAPNEFDTGFEFWIVGISFAERPIEQSDWRVPGFCYLKVNQSVEKLGSICPELVKEGVFQIWGGNQVYLSSKMLHRAVFQSLIDQSCKAIESEIKIGHSSRFSITRKMNPPAVNITVHVDEDAYEAFKNQGSLRHGDTIIPDIDIDIIPALRLTRDTESEYDGEKVNAAIHAICKWKEEESDKALEIANQKFVWLINSVAYERHIFDVARTDLKQQYILMALRFAKTYCTRAELIKKSTHLAPPPVTILQSYHLKQITCYVILYTCYMYPDTVITGVREALEYLLAFLYICLDKGKLPHFFYSNPKITEMFHNYPHAYECDHWSLRNNLFRTIKKDALLQAKGSLMKHMASALKVDISVARITAPAISFSSEITAGKFLERSYAH